MGCSLSRDSFGQQPAEQNASESGERGATRLDSATAEGKSNGNDSKSDIESGILISSGEINQLNEAPRAELGQRIEKLDAAEGGKMSREQPSLKRKLENSRPGSNSVPDGRETKVQEKWNKTPASRTNQLASFISLLINRRKRRSSARIEAADLVSSLSARDQLELSSLAARPRALPPIDDLRAMMDKGPKEEWSSQSGDENLVHPQQVDDNSAILFTSVQQLCYEMINRKLIRQAKQQPPPQMPSDNLTIESTAKIHRHHHRTLCLFVFGLQGSSMGELSFELVEHSSLVNFIQNHHRGATGKAADQCERPARPPEAADKDCPLYHYIDVAALIVANIDQRIGVYNRLVGQTLRARRNQAEVGCGADGPSEGGDENRLDRRAIGIMSSSSSSQDEAREQLDGAGEADSQSAGPQIDNDVASLWSAREASITSDISSKVRPSDQQAGRPTSAGQATDANHQDHQMSHDQFGMETLSTRQRSILQLKLIKYATCVTAKWITILIHAEIARLEAQLRTSLERDSRHSLCAPTRVYLINLVPNQLSLFRSCLYLQQELPLTSFRHSFWAVKLERRTNIKVISKERDTDPLSATIRPDEDSERRQQRASFDQQATRIGSPQHENGNQKLFHKIRLPQIKLPAYLVLRSHSDSNIASASELHSTIGLREEHSRGQPIEVVASNLLANSVNEKLGPKISETFASQFRSLNKLTRLRYNPTRNYNYATASDMGPSDGPQADGQHPGEGTNETSSAQADQCYFRLHHIKLKHDAHTSKPTSSPTSPLECSVASADSMLNCNQPRPFVEVDNASRSATPTSCADSHSNMIDEQHLSLSRQYLAPSTSPSSVISNDSSHLSSISWQNSAGLHSPHSRVAPANSNCSSAGSCFKWAIELELIDAQDNANKWYSKSTSIEVGGAETISGFELPNDIAQGPLATNFRYEPAPAALAPINCCLHVYLPPTRRSSSRSPLALVSTGNGRRSAAAATGSGDSRGCSGVQASVCHTGHYYLVSTPVAYANGKSQPILEAKTVHKRIVRYSSARSDSPRLAKLIGKAEGQLRADLGSWLRASLENGPPIGQVASASHSTSNHNHHQHGRHQPATPQHQHKLAGCMTPHLVTYTIRIDVTKLLKRASKSSCHDLTNEDQLAHNIHLGGSKSEHSPGQLSPNDLAHLLQMQPERPALSKRPASALADPLALEHDNRSDRCLSSRQSLQPTDSPANGHPPNGQAASSGRQSSRSATDVAATAANSKPRHVQFRLNRAPQQGESHAMDRDGCDSDPQSNTQRRIWIKESLFISCSDKKLNSAIDLFANDLFPQVTEDQKHCAAIAR